MPTVRVQTDAKEPIGVHIVDEDGTSLTGVANLKLRVRRTSDGKFLDWSDNTFKAGAAVVTLLRTLAEVDAVYNPGFYNLNTAPHTNGFDLSVLNTKVANDTYQLTVDQDGAPQNADNVPQSGEIKEGQFVDLIGDAATPAEVATALEDIRLHQIIASDPGAALPVAGTYMGQLLTSVLPYVVMQTFSYNQTADRLDGMIWIERDNLVFNTAALALCTTSWYDKDGVLQFAATNASPDAQGFYRIEQNAPGLVADQLYYAISEVVLTDIGTVSGGKGSFTF